MPMLWLASNREVLLQDREGAYVEEDLLDMRDPLLTPRPSISNI